MTQVLPAPQAAQVNVEPNWVEQVKTAARGVEDELADPRELSAIVERLLGFATQCGTQMVTGASPMGNQLAGLVAARAAGTIALWSGNGARGTVLVLEGVLSSGVQLLTAARRARAAGAERVVGAAILADEHGLQRCRAEIGDQVVGLRELQLTY